MADIRRRNIIYFNEGDVNPTKLRATEVSDTPVDSSEYVDSEDDKLAEKKGKVEQGTDATPEVLGNALQGLSDRWKNWVIRVIFTVIMIVGFSLIIYSGPLALIIMSLAAQTKCFQEVISIGNAVYRVHGLPWLRSLSWYFFFTFNYFLYGAYIIDYYGIDANTSTSPLRFLVSYHRFLSFCWYGIGIVWFGLALTKKYNKRQFSLFALTHVALFFIVFQSYLIIHNIIEGIFWYLLPIAMIICNDIMAYVFGFFFGKTPLIKLSPKKTWEGFIGGGLSTVVFGLLFSTFLSSYPYFICPIHYSDKLGYTTMACGPSSAYLISVQEYTIGMSNFTISFKCWPFLLHSISLSIFSSVIGPFGGFFASGFKRAFKIKDFGGMIPGHGGLMDRFDCQFLMGSFVHVYISSFIRTASPQKLLTQILRLDSDHQLQFYHQLKDSLEKQDLLNLN